MPLEADRPAHPDRELMAALARVMRVATPADPAIDLLLHDIARVLERACEGEPCCSLALRAAPAPPLLAIGNDNGSG